MNKLHRGIALTTILVASNGVSAQDQSSIENQLRLDFGMNSTAIGFVNGTEQRTLSDTGLDTTVTFQAKNGMFGQFGYASRALDSVTVNGRITMLNESYSTNKLGFGYRMPTSRQDQYVGVGYQRHWVNYEGSISRDRFHVFAEKNNKERYGVIGLVRTSSSGSDSLVLSGQHVWFLNDSVGLGVNWGAGSGSGTLMPSTSGVYMEFGFNIMYRPLLNFL